MKRIAYFLGVVVLLVLIFVQYDKYTRNHPPSQYAHPIHDSIDVNYYDSDQVMAYYEAAAEAGEYGRHIWKSYKIDVKNPQENNVKEGNFAQMYQVYVRKAEFQEEKLKRSKHLKNNGFTNKDIKIILEEGHSPLAYKTLKLMGGKEFLTSGDTGPEVYELQKLLRAKNFDIPVDGYFAIETLAAVENFQRSVNLYPTGKADALVIERLLIQE